ncbi:MAG TPA: hypothetical protein VFW65_38835 [Pseudonocardiaceae bacterium]|nr:hypothetical protein [Pseudonocardiaceae bacterium]
MPDEAEQAVEADEKQDSRPEQDDEPGPETTEDDDALHFHQQASVINNYVDPTASRRVTGTIRPAEIAKALRAFVPPNGFDLAARCLGERRLVILSGEEGVGKRTSALAALRDQLSPGQPVTSLPPSLTLAGLVDYPHFKEGRGYLVQDWPASGTGPSTAFDIDVLQRVLRRRDAYLVITTGTAVSDRRSVSDVVQRWSAPDPIAVLDRLLPATGVAPADEDLTRLRDRLGQVHSPSDVVKVVERLDRGVDEALAALGDADRERVADWFAADPDGRELLTIAALCFLDDVPESIFQRLLARLFELAGGDHPPADRDTPTTLWFPQHHAGDPDKTLDHVVRVADAEGLGNFRRRFRSDRYLGLVLHELTTRYGFQLWEPLRAWLGEVVQEPPSPLHVALARGVAHYAKEAPSDVQQTYLDDWADGTTLSERLTAAYLLSWLCLDDALASWALRTAAGWTTNAGTRRAATAAMAFGAQLGVRYPSDALSWLWFLALRNQAVSGVAAISLGGLLREAVVDETSTTTILRYLDRALHQLLTEGVNRPEHGSYTRHVRKATSTVLVALTLRLDESTESTTALILRAFPRNVEVLGLLWGEVLRSWPHRTKAIDGLRMVLDAMSSDDESLRVVGEFGAAVRGRLSDLECDLLHRDLGHLLNHGDAVVSPTVAKALLTALERQATVRP